MLPSKAIVTGVGQGFLVRTQLYPQQSLSLSWYSFSGKIQKNIITNVASQAHTVRAW